tara:strand:+ start:341 stop:523 length:183 start_codon:yes stop_codon:yes gene_type:complete
MNFMLAHFTILTVLAKGAFDKAAWPDLAFDFIDTVPASLFHAIWVEISGRVPAKLDPLKV